MLMLYFNSVVAGYLCLFPCLLLFVFCVVVIVVFIYDKALGMFMCSRSGYLRVTLLLFLDMARLWLWT